jgi:hypothetical protein
VSRDNVWDVYLKLLSYFEDIQNNLDMQTVLSDEAAKPVVGEGGNGDEHMELLPLRPLPGCARAAAAEQLGQIEEGSEQEEPHNYWTDSSDGSSVFLED